MDLNEMLAAYRDKKIKLQPALDTLSDLEKQIKAHVLATGETGDVPGVTVSIRNGYERVSWDGKALIGYAAAHPEIEQFKSVSVTGPSVAIKVTP